MHDKRVLQKGDFNGKCYPIFENWYKMQIYIYGQRLGG